MDEKVIAFAAGEERLVELAERYCDEKNYCAALRMIYKKIDLHGAEPDDWMFLAEIYDDMEVYEMSINCWFRFLAVCDPDFRADAYEGLAACYFNVGNEPQSAYYYDKLLSEDEEVPAESKMEIARMFTRSPKNRFKVVHPPEKADYGAEIEEGVNLLKSGKYDEAAKRFTNVHPASEFAYTARNYLAVCRLIAGDADAAEKECLALLEKNPRDVQALSTYCAVAVEKKEDAKSREIAQKLCRIPTDDPDEMYKIATVCCECGLHAEAYDKFCLLEETVSYDDTLLYFKAVAACKCGKYRESMESFGKLIDVFPRAEVARYYFNELREYLNGGGDPPAPDYFYKIPQEEKEKRVKLLALLSRVRARELKDYAREFDLAPLLRWAFDEFDGQEAELQLLALNVAARAEEYAFVKEILLDGGVNDVIKIEAARLIFARNKSVRFGIVLCDVFKQIEFQALHTGNAKRKAFVHAYSICVAKYCLLGKDRISVYNRAAAYIYRRLEEKSALALASDKDSLACAVYLIAKRGKGDFDNSVESFRADGEKVRAILKAVSEGE